MAVIGFTFFYFIFLKIFCGIVFSTGISLVGALIAAIVISAIELIPGHFFKQALIMSENERIHQVPAQEALRRLWLAYIVTIPLMVLAILLISIGFSEHFFERVLSGRYREFLGLHWPNLFGLAVGVVIMTLPNMIIVHKGLKAVSRGEF